MAGNMRTVLYFAIFCFVVNVVGADACPNVCHACAENDWTTCNYIQSSQTCSTDPKSLGTTHCGSAVVTYRDKDGQDHTGVIRGCIDCADKKAACFALGGALKARKFWILLKCELKCCTESKCNTQTPDLTQRAITVFKPDVAGPSQCYACAESDEKTCDEQQSIQMCATDQNSLGTTHCGSMIAKYNDTSGNIEDSFIRGCMQCLDKDDKEECFALGGALKARQNWNLLKCRLVCCINDDCNEGSSPPENAVDVFPAKECGSSASSGHQVLSSRVLALAVAFGNIVNHFC